jgi:outer membrane lipase/esterase
MNLRVPFMKFRPRHALAAAALALLAACGGGGSQVDPFEPQRMIVFGDEQSLLTPDGRRYAVNGLADNNGQRVIDCTANPIWVQTVGNAWGLVLAACNPSGRTVNSLQYAESGATVARVRRQIDQHFSGGSVTRTDLITLYAGLHDIVELYAQFPAQSVAQLKAQAAERGRQLADQANRLASANGRVLVLTLPSVGNTPFAIIERNSRPDINRQDLLNDLSGEFNRALRLNLVNDGRLIGLVLADELIDARVRFPGIDGLSNVTEGACSTALPDCTVTTLNLNADPETWLWADSLRLGARAHRAMANDALSRIARVPF